MTGARPRRERVSWLIPVRNGAVWLRRAVDSALGECELDDEILVVDDGSTDHPQAVLPSDARVRVLRQDPLGIAAALEFGRRACAGEFIARLDADDRALPGRVHHQLNAFRADARLGAVGGRAVLTWSGDTPPRGMQHYVAWVNGVPDPKRELLAESPLFHPAVTLRAKALEQVGGWRSGDFPEDYDLWLRLDRAGWSLRNLERDVLELHDHKQRLTRTSARYLQEAFDRLKWAHLEETVLSRPRRVVLWGGRRGSKPWLKRLLAADHEVLLVIDIDGSTRRLGIPVGSPKDLSDFAFDVLFVAVGTRGARDEIRRMIAEQRPDLREGTSWFALR